MPQRSIVVGIGTRVDIPLGGFLNSMIIRNRETVAGTDVDIVIDDPCRNETFRVPPSGSIHIEPWDTSAKNPDKIHTQLITLVGTTVAAVVDIIWTTKSRHNETDMMVG